MTCHGYSEADGGVVMMCDQCLVCVDVGWVASHLVPCPDIDPTPAFCATCDSPVANLASRSQLEVDIRLDYFQPYSCLTACPPQLLPHCHCAVPHPELPPQPPAATYPTAAHYSRPPTPPPPVLPTPQPMAGPVPQPVGHYVVQ